MPTDGEVIYWLLLLVISIATFIKLMCTCGPSVQVEDLDEWLRNYERRHH